MATCPHFPYIGHKQTSPNNVNIVCCGDVDSQCEAHLAVSSDRELIIIQHLLSLFVTMTFWP